MTQNRIRKQNYHYNNFFKNLPLLGKKAALNKLVSQKGKYRGNRGQIIFNKIEFIKENYPEVLV